MKTTTRRNGVRVRVDRSPGGGRTVDADCQCFGHPKRVHSTATCPNLPADADN